MNDDYLHIRCARCGAPRGEHVAGNAGSYAYCRPVTCSHKDWPRSGATFVVKPGDEWCHEHDDFEVNCRYEHEESDFWDEGDLLQALRRRR